MNFFKNFLLMTLLLYSCNALGQGYRVNNFMKQPRECSMHDTVHYYISSSQVVKVVYDEKGRFYNIRMFDDPSLKLVVEQRGDILIFTHYNKINEKHGIHVLIEDGYIISIGNYEFNKVAKWNYLFSRGKLLELRYYEGGIPTQRLLVLKRNGKIWLDTDNLATGKWLEEL